MPEIPIATILQYSPRGTSQIEKDSRTVCYQIKNGKLQALGQIIPDLMKKPAGKILSDFINPNVTLVPIPGSGLFLKGALWTPYEISKMLLQMKLAYNIQPCIERHTAIRKSSIQPFGGRPTVKEHLKTIRIKAGIPLQDDVTLVDDVLTKGSTSMACALALKAAAPEVNIRILAIVRTRGLYSINEYIKPDSQILAYDNNTNETSFPLDGQGFKIT